MKTVIPASVLANSKIREDVAAVATVENGNYILDTEACRAISQKRHHALGLGDLIHAVAKPIAVALKLPCIDPTTKELKPESRCAKRREELNVKFPIASP